MRKSLHNSATGGAILLSVIEQMRQRGRNAEIVYLEAGWVLENNMGMRKPIEMFGGKVDKIHRIYEKRLSGAAETSLPVTARGDVMNVISISATSAADRSHVERRRLILEAHPEVRRPLRQGRRHLQDHRRDFRRANC